MRTAIISAVLASLAIACGSSGPKDALDLPTRDDPTPAEPPAPDVRKMPVDVDRASLEEMEDRVSASDPHFYGGTPLAAAVKAAVDAQKASTNDGIKSVVILTDGAPTSCDTTADPNANDISH